MKPRVMFDTGALIALERGHLSMRKVHRLAVETGHVLVAPTPVVAEWWRRGRREKERLALLRSLLLEAPDGYVARLAGAAIGEVGGTVVDALVMAAASIRGDVVYTSDVTDLERMGTIFTSVIVRRA